MGDILSPSLDLNPSKLVDENLLDKSMIEAHVDKNIGIGRAPLNWLKYAKAALSLREAFALKQGNREIKEELTLSW